ncbi:acyl carrier protein phosphodiesterase [Marinobacter mobilis]|uniref:acyl carrier protein phosphodiesterase n=1 Tax=Marinobacter mobilis TaxID=488533 RepID=UPI0035C6BB87
MNHLAHLYLAPGDPESRVGALLGDFSRGLELDQLPDRVLEGLRHHRAVDAFTDTHPQVLAAKGLFSPQRRRFAGVALDVLFDHYLIRHWSQFSATPIETFIEQAYADLSANRHLMPERMAVVTGRMIRDDWLSRYSDINTIGFVLDRIAERIRFSNRFTGAIDEIKRNDQQLEQYFLAFFPDLVAATRVKPDASSTLSLSPHL